MVALPNEAVFNTADFLNAVWAYQDRHRMSNRGLATAAGMPTKQIAELRNGSRVVTLVSAIRLADVCDLDLDRYRKTSTQQRQWLDAWQGERITRQRERILAGEAGTIQPHRTEHRIFDWRKGKYVTDTDRNKQHQSYLPGGIAT